MLMVRHKYPDSGPYAGQQDKFFTIELHKIVQSPQTKIPFESDRTVTPFFNCSLLMPRLADIDFPHDALEGGLCGDFSQAFEFGGSFEKEESVSFLEILLVPCKVFKPGDC